MDDGNTVIASCAALLDERAQADEFSGSVLIARNGTALLERSYGYASKGYGIRNQVDTLFNIGSMSKMFTAVSIVQLAEQGKLSFDDVVSRHLPDYPSEVANRVTIHHLLTHTSGMGTFWNASYEAVRTSLRSVSDYLPLFVDDPLEGVPGERFKYSNAGYIVLGAIVEQLSGVSYDDYVGEHIYERSGMTHSGAWGLDEDVPNRAIGYVRDGQENTGKGQYPRTNLLVSSTRGSPAGGSYSTVYDLLRFAQALHSHQLLSDEFTRFLLQPRVAMGPGGAASYAYGFGCHEVGGIRIVGHNGGAPGVGAQFDMYLGLGYTVVLLSNYGAGGLRNIVEALRQLLVGV